MLLAPATHLFPTPNMASVFPLRFIAYINFFFQKALLSLFSELLLLIFQASDRSVFMDMNFVQDTASGGGGGEMGGEGKLGVIF